MAEKTTIARPYAQALFGMAQETKQFKKWSEMLQYAAQVAADPETQKIIGNPRFTRAQVIELFLGVCGKHLDANGGNLVRLLAENGRLALLPEIAALYEIARAEAESTLHAEVTAASVLSEAQQKAIAASLKQRLGREVTLSCKVDESLIGGAVIRAGDLVIDGSVASRLERLQNRLMS